MKTPNEYEGIEKGEMCNRNGCTVLTTLSRAGVKTILNTKTKYYGN